MDLHNELKARVVLKGRVSGQAAGCYAGDPLGGDAVDAVCKGKDGGWDKDTEQATTRKTRKERRES